MFDREERDRRPPYGKALDLGCGTGMQSVALALRGWQVTGIDLVPEALRAARERARRTDVQVRFVTGDVAALRAAGVGEGFRFFLDFGCFHGLTDIGREAMGREVNAVAAPDATMLMFTFAPGRRGPLPRSASREDIEAAFPGWEVIATDVVDSSMPGPLKRSAPCCYRFRRLANGR